MTNSTVANVMCAAGFTVAIILGTCLAIGVGAQLAGHPHRGSALVLMR